MYNSFMAERPKHLLLPLWNGNIKERRIEHISVISQPFVEVDIWRYPMFSKVSANIQLGIRDFVHDKRYAVSLMGRLKPDHGDILASYRAMHILDKIDQIENPHDLLGSLNEVADESVYRLNNRYNSQLVNYFVRVVGRSTLKDIHKMIPPNLEDVVTFLLENGARLDGFSLMREVRRGTISDSGVYEAIIADAQNALYQRNFIRRELGLIP